MTDVPTSTPPDLLVSVRSLAEARRILPSSCAIVDVKEPANGPLGPASSCVQKDVARACSGRAVSLALGEVVDWRPRELPVVDFLKLGLAGIGSDPGWRDRWEDVRAEADMAMGAASAWVAVSYADYELADAPRPADVLEAAVESGCAVLLFDTFDKSMGQSLFDCITLDELLEFRAATFAAGLRLAIAGQLRLHHADLIAEVGADIVGIRGAGCVGAARRNEISADAVSQFAEAIGAATQPQR